MPVSGRDDSPASNGEAVIKAFADLLQELHKASGAPSMRELERLFKKLGKPNNFRTINQILNGGYPPNWEFVETFVLACARHAGDHPNVEIWRARHTEMRRDLAATRLPRQTVAQGCPYRGLEIFATEDAPWFHGRAAAIRAVLAGLADHPRALLLLGPSGAGKSSLVRAGVLPALGSGAISGSDRWCAIVTRPGPDLRADVRGDQPAPEPDDRSLRRAVEVRLDDQPTGSRLLLVIDQFEELLTPAATGDDARPAVLDELAALIGTAQLTVVLVMRDDFYPRLAAQAAELLELLKPGLVNIPATLNDQELREIIVNPAEAAGLRLEDDLPERIVGDVLAVDRTTTTTRQAPVTVLPLVELTLQQLWDRRVGGMLTHDAYRRIGGVAGAVTNWCDTVIEKLTATQKATAQLILTALVRPADEERHIPAVRQQLPIANLHELAASAAARSSNGNNGADDHLAHGVLDALTTDRIVTTRHAHAHVTGVGAAQDVRPVAELVHDALIHNWATLREWIGDDHRFQDWLHRAGKQRSRWSQRQDPDDLLHGSDLAEGLDWSRSRSLTNEIAAYVGASRKHQQSRTRLRRLGVIALVALVFISATATVIAQAQRQDATNAEAVAVSRQLAAQSTALLDSDPDLAALLAVQAYRTSRTDQAAASLYAAAALPLRHRLTAHSASPQAVAFSPNGRVLASGGADHTVRLWETETGKLVATFTGHTDVVFDVAFSPDGRMLASGSRDETVRLWNVASGETTAVLTGHHGYVDSVAFSPDGRSLAAGGGTEVRLWDTETSACTAVLTYRTRFGLGSISSLAFSPDGRTLATGGSETRLWDIATRQSRPMPDDGISTTVTVGSPVAFSPDGQTLAGSPGITTVRLWNVASGQTRTNITGRNVMVRSMAFSPDGNVVASTSEDDQVLMWDTATGNPLASLIGHKGPIVDMAFSPDRRTLATAGIDHVRLWDVSTGRTRITLAGNTPSYGATSLAFSPDGHTLASVAFDATARLWDVSTGQILATLDGDARFEPSGWNSALSRDGRKLATTGSDGAILVRDIMSGKSIAELIDRHLLPGELAFSPDGRTLAVAARRSYELEDKSDRDYTTIRLWDITAGHILINITGHTDLVEALQFSPDGRILATASQDNTVRLWNTDTGEQRAVLTGHTGTVRSVAFSFDGRTLASSSTDDNTVRLWDVDTGALRASLPFYNAWDKFSAFSWDGRTLASATRDDKVRLWDTVTGQTRVTFTGHNGLVSALAFSPDGHTLASGGQDGTIRLWEIALPDAPHAMTKICEAVNRSFTSQERTTYLQGANASARAPCSI